MISAPLIADYIIATVHPLTPMQINKLAYISHGFTLALKDDILFSDKVEAWRYGPVVPSIYYMLRDYGGGYVLALQYCGTMKHDSEMPSRLEFLKKIIPEHHRNIIDDVLKKYGKFSGPGLSTITHEEGTPWHQCYKAGKLGTEIPNSITKKYYRSQLQQ